MTRMLGSTFVVGALVFVGAAALRPPPSGRNVATPRRSEAPLAANSLSDWILAAERAEPHEQWALLCFLAGRNITVDAIELHAALRRSELLLAAGGDPRRPLELFGRAVSALARDLDDPTLRAQLAVGLAALTAETDGLRGATEALRLLREDADLAWRAYAMALLAEQLAAEDEEPVSD